VAVPAPVAPKAEEKKAAENLPAAKVEVKKEEAKVAPVAAK